MIFELIDNFTFVWNRWVNSWSFQDGILFLPIDVYFFSGLWISIFFAYVIYSLILSPLLFTKSIKGKLVQLKALVTGGAQGIGKEISTQLAKQGADLVIWDINDAQLRKTSEEFKEQFPNLQIFSYKCDVSNYADVKRVSELMKEEIFDDNNHHHHHHQYVEILVNNAGVVSGKNFDLLTENDVLRTFGVNTIAHYWTLTQFLPEMKKRNNGHIVTIASTCGIFSAAGLSDYCASKFAVIGFHDCIRLELRKQRLFGVQMTLICPNTTNTGMFDGVKQGFTWLFPVLSPSYVGSVVVDSIRRNESHVYLPKTLRPGIAIIPSLPVIIKDYIMDFAGVSNAMDSFRGRSKSE